MTMVLSLQAFHIKKPFKNYIMNIFSKLLLGLALLASIPVTAQTKLAYNKIVTVQHASDDQASNVIKTASDSGYVELKHETISIDGKVYDVLYPNGITEKNGYTYRSYRLSRNLGKGKVTFYYCTLCYKNVSPTIFRNPKFFGNETQPTSTVPLFYALELWPSGSELSLYYLLN